MRHLTVSKDGRSRQFIETCCVLLSSSADRKCKDVCLAPALSAALRRSPYRHGARKSGQMAATLTWSEALVLSRSVWPKVHNGNEKCAHLGCFCLARTLQIGVHELSTQRKRGIDPIVESTRDLLRR